MRSINGAISNDLERTLTLFSRSHHSLMLNISQTATDTAIVTTEGVEFYLYPTVSTAFALVHSVKPKLTE